MNCIASKTNYTWVPRAKSVARGCRALATCLLAAGLTAAAVRAGAPGKPNILFFLADDMGFGDLASFGHPYLATPNLDRLAASGTSFSQFYAASPVCSPSRAAFLTGRFPIHFGIHGHLSSTENNRARDMPDWLDPHAPNLVRHLQQAGYRTGHFGKWHLGPEGKTRIGDKPIPADYGWDEFRGRDSFGMFEVATDDPARPFDPYYRAKSTGLYVDAALEFIARSPSQPFLINLWTLVPHAALNPTPDELSVYRTLAPDWTKFAPSMREYAARAKDPGEQLRVYAAAVSGLDAALGRLLAGLERLGVLRNTLIIFSSDNGPEDYVISNARNAGMGYAGALRGRKRSLYEGGVRVPLIVSWPGRVPAGRVDRETVLAAVDLFPTLAAIAGAGPVAAGAKVDGEDVSAALFGQPFERRGALFWEWRFGVNGAASNKAPRLAMRRGQWKYFCEPDGNRAELFDLRQDPGERHNRVMENPDVANALNRELRAFFSTASHEKGK